MVVVGVVAAFGFREQILLSDLDSERRVSDLDWIGWMMMRG
jgi:hypothetical protein